ncbi:MAG: ammonium transporter, partial [Candidatus Binataceae bacterium]
MSFGAKFLRPLLAAVVGTGLSASIAWGAETTANTGDTAWVIAASALVLFMTLPGLALFYGGLVRARNVLSVLMHCFVICCIVSILWAIGAYSLAFDGAGAWVGDMSAAWLANLAPVREGTTVPEVVYVMFQMTFAIITPGLIIGAFPERVTFRFILLFTPLWLMLVYVPAAHWVWGGGWLAKMGALDFAG